MGDDGTGRCCVCLPVDTRAAEYRTEGEVEAVRSRGELAASVFPQQDRRIDGKRGALSGVGLAAAPR